MIIVSQDKDMIINFENVEIIYIEDFDIPGKTYSRISADTKTGGVALGDYETEERAKKVLQEIISAYEHSEHLKCEKTTIVQLVFDKDFIYRMPEV